MFREQVSVLSEWFRGWNECEQTVALLSLLKRLRPTQARFLQLCLQHSLSDSSDLQQLEEEANDPVAISQWEVEPKERLIPLLLSHLPLLAPGNLEAKGEYMRLLPWVLAHTIERRSFLDESRQLVSYALIHPATSPDDRAALALWLNHLEERAGATPTHPSTTTHSPEECLNGWAQSGEDSHLLLQPATSLPAPINPLGTGASAVRGGVHPTLKRSASLTPPLRGSAHAVGHFLSQEDLRGSPNNPSLSPQGSITSSGSEDALGGGASAGPYCFKQDMRDVPAWLKSLRLHKYAALFSTMTYDEMMSLTEEHLEAQKVTKGARHKIIISIQKLRERQSLLHCLEKEVLGGVNLRSSLQELHQMVVTPMRTFSEDLCPAQRPLLASQSCSGPAGGETQCGGGIISEEDLPAQFTRVMGKVCTQLLVSQSDEENISSYLQLIDKCVLHESFTDAQKKRLLSWKQQVQKLYRSMPRRSLLESAGYRPQRSRADQSSSLPSSACGGVSRRVLAQVSLPSRSLPGARLGLLGATRRTNTNAPTGQWFANPGGNLQTHSSVQRTRSLPVHPQGAVRLQTELQVTDINNRLESLCRSMTEHALGDGTDRMSTI